MMENESLRGSRNTSTVLLAVLLVFALVWAVIGTAVAVKRTRAVEALKADYAQYKSETDQKLMEAQRQVAEAEQIRKVALQEMRRHQMQLQQEMRAKQAAAQKPAVVKPATPNKAKSSAPAKKTVHH